MKMRKLFSFMLALTAAFAVTVPVSAEDEEILLELEKVPEWVDVQIQEEVWEPDSAVVPEPEPEPEPEPDITTEPAPEPEPDTTADPEPEPDAVMEPNGAAEGEMIEVVVPAIGEVVLNPYRLKVDTASGQTRDQIIHTPQPVTNNSDFPVLVKAAAVGTIAPDSLAKFVAAPPAPDTKEKEVFLYVEFQNQSEEWTGTYTGGENQVLVMPEGGEGGGVLRMDAHGSGYFRLFGAMSTDVEPMWGSSDAITVTLSYTFTRADEQAGSGPEVQEPAVGDTSPGEDESEANKYTEGANKDASTETGAAEGDNEPLEEPIIEPEYTYPPYEDTTAKDTADKAEELAEESVQGSDETGNTAIEWDESGQENPSEVGKIPTEAGENPTGEGEMEGTVTGQG